MAADRSDDGGSLPVPGVRQKTTERPHEQESENIRFERTTTGQNFQRRRPPDPAGGGFAASDRIFSLPPTNAQKKTAKHKTGRQPRRVGHHLLHCLESTPVVDSIPLVSSVSDAPLVRRSVEKRYPSRSIRKTPGRTRLVPVFFLGYLFVPAV